jgi:DNA-directed RNA polymerase subunit M/transcription elongation factor TFIIS
MKKIISLGLIFGVGLALAGCQKNSNDIYKNDIIIPTTTQDAQTPQTDEVVDAFEIELEVATDTNKTATETTQSETIVEEDKAAASTTKTTDNEDEEQIAPYSFNKCGTRWQFKEESWYPEFAEKLVNNPVLTSLEAARIVGTEDSDYKTAQEAMNDYGNLSEKNVAYICRSTGEEIAIMMINGSTDLTGGLMKYDISNKTLALAPIEPYENMYLYAFTARAGAVIPVKAGIRDDNCTYTFKVDYNFMDNSAVPVKKCTTCGNSAEVCESLID